MASQDERAEASSLLTPPERLAELGRHRDRELRALVAANPSTDLPTAILLCREFPRAFLENPSFPLWLLSHPSLFSTLEMHAACALARLDGLPGELLWALAESEFPTVREQVAASSMASEDLLVHLGQITGTQRYGDFQMLRRLAQNPRSPPRLLERLGHIPYLARDVGEHPGTPPYVLREMLTYKQTGSWNGPVARGVPEATEWRMMRGEAPARRCVAESPTTTEHRKRRLGRDDTTEVRQAVARNRNAPAATLLALTLDRNKNTRRAALINLQTQRNSPA